MVQNGEKSFSKQDRVLEKEFIRILIWRTACWQIDMNTKKEVSMQKKSDQGKPFVFQTRVLDLLIQGQGDQNKEGIDMKHLEKSTANED